MLILNKLPHYRPHSLSSKITNMAVNPFPGADIGIPLTIFQGAYTTLHYGNNIVNIKSVIIEFLLGFYAYGGDRYTDALNYNELKFNTTKAELYEYINENSGNIASALFLSKLLIFLFLSDNILLYSPFLITVESIPYYNEIKKTLGKYKALYIAFLWTASAVILPSVIHDQNYNILLSPLDYLPCTLTLFAASNVADNKDVIEDKLNNIETLPVLYGEKMSNIISLYALLFSSFFLIINPHFYNNQEIGTALEIQNAGLAALPFII